MISEIAVYFKKGGNIYVDIDHINKLKNHSKAGFVFMEIKKNGAKI